MSKDTQNESLSQLEHYMKTNDIQEILHTHEFVKSLNITKMIVKKSGSKYGLTWESRLNLNSCIQMNLEGNGRDVNGIGKGSEATASASQPSFSEVTQNVGSLSLDTPASPSLEKASNHFFGSEIAAEGQDSHSAVLMGESTVLREKNYGYFGKIKQMKGIAAEERATTSKKDLFLAVSKPFCLVCVGVQGSGKSHTMNVVLENCLTHIQAFKPHSPCVTSVKTAMCGLVLHYDQSDNNVCEATGLQTLSSILPQDGAQGLKKMVILVSPTYYKQRKKFYETMKGFTVLPLLFKWASLTADQLKKIMRLNDNDSQLYVSVMLDMLRSYQREGVVQSFQEFEREVEKKCNLREQGGPLKQRLTLLQSVVAEAPVNSTLKSQYEGLPELMASGTLIVADLTDPLLSSDEANGLFQVLLQQFRRQKLEDGVGKVVAFDEAHKYLGGGEGGKGKDGLSAAIVDSVRLMRHEGLRVLISTQSPTALPEELLELVTVTAVHNFQSSNWYQNLKNKIPIGAHSFAEVQQLKTGEAIVVCTKMNLLKDRDSDLEERQSVEDKDETGDNLANNSSEGGSHYFSPSSVIIKIRPRATMDYGATRVSA